MELTLEIEDSVYSTLERRAEMNDFDSPELYSETILETVLDELESGEAKADVEDRLEDLGYLS